jgi:hypothetical protein
MSGARWRSDGIPKPRDPGGVHTAELAAAQGPLQAMSTEEKNSRRPPLPDGYRLVALASDNWVLVAPGGSWVDNYWGGLDLWRAALDADKHDRARSRAL